MQQDSASLPLLNSPWVRILLVALAYALLAQCGLVFAAGYGQASIVWPAAGLALATVVLGGPGFAAAIACAAFAVSFAAGMPPVPALLLALGNAAAALAGAAMLRRSVDFSPRLERVQDVQWLVVLGALASAAIAATFGATALLIAGMAARSMAVEQWLTWWAGDSLGVLVMAPMLLAWSQSRRIDGHAGSAVAAAACIAGLAFLATAVLRVALPEAPAQTLVAFALLPLAIGLALRLGPRDVATFNVLLGATLLVGGLAGLGPFAEAIARGTPATVFVALACISFTTLIVAAALAERRRGSERLAASERHFRELIELSIDWYWEQDEDLRFTRLSRGFEAATGMVPRDVLGRRYWELADGSRDDRRWREHRRTLEARKPFRDFEVACTGRDGTCRTFMTTGEPLFGDDGRFRGYRGIGRDVTGHRRAEEALRESEERYASVFHSGAAAMFTVAVTDDGEFRFEEMNAAAEVLMGLVARDIIGKTPKQTLPPRAAASGYQRLQECLAKDTPVTFEDDVPLPSGDRSALYTFVPIHDAMGRVRRIVGIAVDTTERRRVERRLRESTELFGRIFTTTAQPMLITRVADGAVTEVNPAWCALTGRGRAEVVGRTLGELRIVSDEAERARSDALLGARGSVRNLPLRVMRADGEPGEVLYCADVIDILGEPSVLTTFVDITEAKRAEAAIRRSQQHFELLFRSSPQPLALSGIDDGRVYDVNDLWTRTYGYSREQLLGRNFVESGLWVDLDARRRLREQLERDGAVRNFECRWRRSSGEIADVLLAGACIDYDGKRLMLSTGVDITERKRAERLLRESESRFAKFFQSSPVPVVIATREEGRYLEVNDAWVAFFGYSRAEAIGRSALELGLWAVPEERAAYMESIRRQGRVIDLEVRLRKRRGELIDGLVSGVPLELAGEACLIVSVINITERKRAEEQLRASERRFRDFAEAAGEYVWEIDRDARYTFLSQRVEVVIGYRPQELYGRRPYDFMPPGEAERLQELITEALAAGQSLRNVEHRSLTRTGALAWLLASAVPIFAADGRVSGLRGTVLDITERKRAEARIEELATRDPLTGLPNRLLLADRLGQGIAGAARSGDRLAVMFIDLDHFKQINDTLGHQVGDHLLKDVARRLGAVVRKQDTLARLGGDEFVIVLEGMRSSEDAAQIAQKVLHALAQPFTIEGQELHTAGSVGIALYPVDGEDASTLMRNADTAMYAAKSSGRKNYQFFSAEMNSRALERLRLESALRRAAEGGELRLFWQPRVEIDSGEITGVEALLRWRHPDQGLIGPDRFMRVAEESGLAVSIGEWALHAACRQGQVWAELAASDVPIAVNVSGREFGLPLADSVAKVLDATRLPARLLEIELTESTLMRNPEMSRLVLGRLADLGVRIVVDNFGIGHASMHSLRRFSVGAIKIDRSLVAGLGTSAEDRIVVKAIIEMARSLGVTPIASGVETDSQLEALSAMGCREYLGHHFLPPLPAPELERRLLPGSNVRSLESRG
jgi:diguanylate cyclase (GGDEF)-like protein/PAS domain S-box-containing protein